MIFQSVCVSKLFYFNMSSIIFFSFHKPKKPKICEKNILIRKLILKTNQIEFKLFEA